MAKIKAVSMKLIWAFVKIVFAYAKSRFSNDAGHVDTDHPDSGIMFAFCENSLWKNT